MTPRVPTQPRAPQTPREPLARNVKVLSAVSFLTDVASEMIYPLLPLYLVDVLGATSTDLGALEITRRALIIAADICIYTNHNIIVEKIS